MKISSGRKSEEEDIDKLAKGRCRIGKLPGQGREGLSQGREKKEGSHFSREKLSKELAPGPFYLWREGKSKAG